MGGGTLPAAAVGWLVALIAGYTLTVWSTLRRETAETRVLATSLITAAGDQLTSGTLPEALTHGTRRLADFTAVTQPLETAIQQKEQAAAPLAEEVRELALTLQTLGRSLHAGTTRPPQG